MKYMIWPRQYGKSYQLRQWWVEDPAHRVILVENTDLAKMTRDDCRVLLQEKFPDNTDRENRLLTRNRIYSYRTWLGPTLPRTGDLRQCDVAVDGLEYILNNLFKGNVVWAAGVGRNEIPDPAHADRAEIFHREIREKFPMLMTDEQWAEEGM